MRKPISDVDGNELPPPPPDSDLAQIQHALLFGRRNDFQIGPYIRIGNITMQVRDLRQRPSQDGIPEIPPWVAAGLDTP